MQGFLASICWQFVWPYGFGFRFFIAGRARFRVILMRGQLFVILGSKNDIDIELSFSRLYAPSRPLVRSVHQDRVSIFRGVWSLGRDLVTPSPFETGAGCFPRPFDRRSWIHRRAVAIGQHSNGGHWWVGPPLPALITLIGRSIVFHTSRAKRRL